MLARVTSAAVLGIEAYLVDVEVDLAAGLPSFATVGLPHGAVKESRERVNAAVQNAGFTFPLARLTCNLAPADIPKAGSGFDLPIALGILAASEQLDVAALRGWVVLGELGLDGEIRPVRGALSMAIAARQAGCAGLIVPRANAREAAVVEGLDVRGAATLADVTRHLARGPGLEREQVDVQALFLERAGDEVDFAEVRGQDHAKRALEVAAAGGHNVLMIGAPGSGKTMLARRLPSILPALSLGEALETTRIHSVAGTLRSGDSLLAVRPFRAPHHSISDAGLIGGGSYPRPGEVSLAHHGVLFLDELPEFRRNVLEVLRQPLEDGAVSLSRAATSVTFPARFMLAGAMNPCPCGHYGDAQRPCICQPPARQRYLARISGPLLDRIDIHLDVPAVPLRQLSQGPGGEPSAAVRERVGRARQLQQQRFAARPGVHANAHMTARDLRAVCRLSDSGDALLRTAIVRLGLSARAYHRILKIARTIADLAAAAAIEPAHVSEAVQYRGMDRRRAGVAA